MTDPGNLAIVDLGGQYCHLISRRLRDLGFRSQIIDSSVHPKELKGYAGVILSGGPNSVYDARSPRIDADLLGMGLPLLGICYGHQLLAQHMGATVTKSDGEYGKSQLSVFMQDTIFEGTPTRQTVWMSHSDSVTRLPQDMRHLARTPRCEIAAFANVKHRMFGVQFHPEVMHSAHGAEILGNFGTAVCGIQPSIGLRHRVQDIIQAIRDQVGRRSVFFLVSGGVDSTVAFALCARALSRDQVRGLYVDTGLMRKNETAELRDNLRAIGLDDRLMVRDESDRFLASLEGVQDPEEKRRIIGRLFVEVQSEAFNQYIGTGEGWLLGQGTIYPDTIESGGSTGKAAVIKTHHNRCQEILDLIEQNLVLEPLSLLYKDEVRNVGTELSLNPKLTNRWPFPGPGLAIRCLATTQAGNQPVIPLDLPEAFGKYLAVRVPLRSVGVQGDARTYRDVAAISGELAYPVLQELSSDLSNSNTSINRVVLLLAGPDLKELFVKPAQLTRARLETLREADAVVRTVMDDEGLTDAVWQFPVVIIPLSLEGGDSIVLRPVNSEDGMTANFAQLPARVLRRMADGIQGIAGVDAVLLDITDKPPSTIEWE